MSAANEVKARLDSLGTLGLITIGFMPETPDVIGTIYEYGGQAMERRFGILGIGYEKPALQIVFRGAPSDYQGPRDKAFVVFGELAKVAPGPITNGGTIYLEMNPQQSPFPVVPPDKNLRVRIGFNFYIMKEPS